MGRIKTGIRIAAVGMAMAALSACQLGSYGKSSSYAFDVANPIEVTIPANAPSVIQQFRPLSGEKGPEEGGAHPGIDIYEARGFPVLAAADGVVTSSGFGGSYGHKITVAHGVGPRGRQLITVYKHLNSRAVEVGAHIKRGQQIATMGSTGILAAGIVHLHFETHEEHGNRTIPKDPHLFWAGGVGQITCYAPGGRFDPQRLTYPVPCR